MSSTRPVAAFLLALPLLGQSPETLIEGGHYKRARALLEPLVAKNPNDARAACLLAKVKGAFNDLDAALKLAEKGVTLDSKSVACHFVLAETVGTIAERASVLKQLGLAKRFKKEIDATLALDPKHLDALFDLLRYYTMAPGIMGGDKQKAGATLDQIRQIDATRGYLAEAWLAQREKQTDRLEALYRQAVEANPGHYEARMALAHFLAGRRDYANSELQARAALDRDPSRAAAYGLLASLYVQQRRWADLDAILALSDRNCPDSRIPHYRAAYDLLADASDLPRAERYLRHYLAQEPEPGAVSHAHAYWRLALVLEKQGRKPEAIAALETAVKLKPDLDLAKKDLRRLKS
jgi:tetratricopeptide (TPR) repeat protein